MPTTPTRTRRGWQLSSFSRSVLKAQAEFAELAVRMPYYRSGEFLLELPEPAQSAPPGAADVPAEQIDELRRKMLFPPALSPDKNKKAAFREALELGRTIEQKYPQAANLPVVRCAMLVAARWLATQTPDSGLGLDDPLARELDIYGLPRSMLLDREGRIYQWGYPGQVISGIMYRVFAPQPSPPQPSPPPKPLPTRRESKIASGGPAPASARPAGAELPKAISLDLGGKASMKLVLIPAGEFIMGTVPVDKSHPNNEEAQQLRYLTTPFYMGVHHVTRGQFAAFVRQTNYKTEAELEGWSFAWNGGWRKVEGASWRKCGFDQDDDHPVVCVSFNDAVEFCNWLGETSGKNVRLPTETQWEYACRAGTATTYPWGAKPEDGKGWCNGADRSAAGAAGDKKFPPLATFDWDDGYVFTSPVGKFKANALGLYDMTGNTWQWCSDWYGLYNIRGRSGAYDPIGPASGTYRVTRGGSWNSGPDYCRSAARRPEPPAACTNVLGFRVVVVAP